MLQKPKKAEYKMKMIAIALISAFVMSGCGGGGGGGSAPATATAKTTPPTPPATCASLLALGTPLNPKCHVTIDYRGDSTNYGEDIDDANKVQYPGIGQGIAGRTNPAPAQLLQTWADRTYGAGVVGVIDDSIPGSTFASDMNGTAPSLSPLATALASLPVHADIVMANYEINDQYGLISVPQFTLNAAAYANTVSQYGAVMVYQEPNPISQFRPTDYPTYNDQIQATNALTTAADQTVIAHGGHVLGNLLEWENYTTPPNVSPWNVVFMSSDGVHPNDAGYAFKASNYFNGVPSILGTTDSLKIVITGVLQGISP